MADGVGTAVPKHWEKYDRYYKIGELPIVVGKTPMNERISVAEDDKFTFRILLEEFPKIGLVIDLTNDTKFYNPVEEELSLKGIQYYKVGIPTSGEVTEPKVKEYLEILGNFLYSEKSRGKVVFLHSGFGHWRCCFMLARFLTDVLGFTPEYSRAVFYGKREFPKFKKDENKPKLIADRFYGKCKEKWLDEAMEKETGGVETRFKAWLRAPKASSSYSALASVQSRYEEDATESEAVGGKF